MRETLAAQGLGGFRPLHFNWPTAFLKFLLPLLHFVGIRLLFISDFGKCKREALHHPVSNQQYKGEKE